MPLPLRTIFAKLYSPPADGVRQAIALSRSDAEKLPILESVAVVSITAPEKLPANLQAFPHILRMSFADVDFLSLGGRSPRTSEKLKNLFTEEQARQVRFFVEALPDEVRTVVVHCEGGYSRSTAVVRALHELYGYVVEHEQLRQANPSVLAVMLRR